MEALKKVLDPIFGIDLRSLALIRVSLAFLVLAELYIRSGFLISLLHGNDNTLPQPLIESTWYTPWTWSIHLLFGGTPSFLILVFILHACAALCLLTGYRTRVATIITWVLLISLDHANPFVMNGGNYLLRLFLFISIFLPLGATFSIDQTKKFTKNDTLRVLSPWSAAFLIQMLCMYLFSALSKHFGSEWLAGDALYYILSMDHIASPLGKLLLNTPTILPYLTFAVFYFEHAIPLLLLSPYRTVLLRSLTLGLLVVMHLSFALFLNIGLFSFVSIMGLVVFIPTKIWDRLTICIQKNWGRVHTLFYLVPLEKIRFVPVLGEKYYRFMTTYCPGTYRSGENTNTTIKATTFIISTLGSIYIIFILLWNIVDVAGGASSLKISQNTWRFALTLGIDQSWRLFVANGIKNNSWYVIPGTLEDGSYVDVYRNGAPLSFERRPSNEKIYESEHWRKYLTFIKRPENHAYRIQYAKLLCNKWNKEHTSPKKLLSLELGTMNIPIPPPGEKLPKPGYINLLSWRCEQPEVSEKVLSDTSTL